MRTFLIPQLAAIIYISICFLLTGYSIYANTHACEIGTEKDEWKLVLPYQDLCKCTRVILGGLNTQTPIHPVQTVSFDDTNAILDHYELRCGKPTSAKSSAYDKARTIKNVTSNSEDTASSKSSTATEGSSSRKITHFSATTKLATSITFSPGLNTPTTSEDAAAPASMDVLPTTMPPVCDYEYLGMEDGDIPDENIAASSDFADIFQAKEARLNGVNYWAPSDDDIEPWIQADVGYQTYINGVITQGDGRFNYLDWVTSFKVSAFFMSTSDEEAFVSNEVGMAKVFWANTDAATPVISNFPEPIYARVVRITCLGKGSTFFSLRFEIIGCK